MQMLLNTTSRCFLQRHYMRSQSDPLKDQTLKNMGKKHINVIIRINVYIM